MEGDSPPIDARNNRLPHNNSLEADGYPAPPDSLAEYGKLRFAATKFACYSAGGTLILKHDRRSAQDR